MEITSNTKRMVAISKNERKAKNTKGKKKRPQKQRQGKTFRESPFGKISLKALSNLYYLLFFRRYVSVLSIINIFGIILISKLNYTLSYPLYAGIYLVLTALNITLPRIRKGKLARFSVLDIGVLLLNLVLTYLFINTGINSMFSVKYVYPAISFLVINILIVYFEEKKFERLILKYRKGQKEREEFHRIKSKKELISRSNRKAKK